MFLILGAFRKDKSYILSILFLDRLIDFKLQYAGVIIAFNVKI